MSDVIRILVIDDSLDDRELYRRALNKSADARYEYQRGTRWRKRSCADRARRARLYPFGLFPSRT